MRNMSFAITTAQILEQSKDVTRRLGWEFLKVGDVLQPVKKCMGLRPGERIEKLGSPIRVVDLRRERLDRMAAISYGFEECRREGFPEMSPAEFMTMFCATHKGCTPETVITRIEFSYRQD
jgi:hypothetical protein